MHVVSPSFLSFAHVLAEGVIGINANWDCTYWNPAMESFTQINSSDAIGKPIHVLITDLQLERHRKKIHSILTAEKTEAYSLGLISIQHQNKPSFYHMKFVPVHEENPPHIGIGVLSPFSFSKAQDLPAEEIEFIFQNLHQAYQLGVTITDHEGNFEAVSPSFEKIFGYKVEELVGQHFTMLIPKEKKEWAQKRYIKSNSNVAGRARRLWELQCKDGSYITCLVDSSLIIDPNGHFKRIGFLMRTGGNVPLLERPSIENTNIDYLINQRTESLEMMIEELETISFSISHDLRAPLRHIIAYGELFQRKFMPKEQLAQKYLSNMVKSGNKMMDMLNNLLSFSRIHQQEIHYQEVDLNFIIRDTWKMLRHNQEPRAIQIKISYLPKIQVDSTFIQQIWLNLLSNAIKYTSKEAKPEIEIGYDETHSEWIFFIKDNGVGFDMHYKNKLFQVFQRLHSEQEFEGSGIGLAHVHRMLVIMQGKIWAESKKGEGATFFFSLPKQPILAKTH